MASVFICHSSQDKPFALRMYNVLKENEIDVWMDESDLYVGDSLFDKVMETIKHVDYFIVILSPEAVKSGWVQTETNFALNAGCRILPVLYRDCHIPSCLSHLISVDFRDPSAFNSSMTELFRGLGVIPNRRPRLVTPLASGRHIEPKPVLIAEDIVVDPQSITKALLGSFAINRRELFGIVSTLDGQTYVAANALAGLAPFSGKLNVFLDKSTHVVSYGATRNPFGSPAVRIAPYLTNDKFDKYFGRKKLWKFMTEDVPGEGSSTSPKIEEILKDMGRWGCVKDRLGDKTREHSWFCKVGLMICRALVTNPLILIVNNLVDGLSSMQRSEILQRLLNLTADGLTVIIASSDFASLAPWCDRIAILDFHDDYYGVSAKIGRPVDFVSGTKENGELKLLGGRIVFD